MVGALWLGVAVPLPKEVEEDEAVGLGEGLVGDLAPGFGSAGVVP